MATESEILNEIIKLLEYVARQVDHISKKIKNEESETEAYSVKLSKKSKPQ